MEQEHDLLIIVDATASMSRYLAALNHSLPQIISVSALTGCFSRIGLLAYRDYCDSNLLKWSGWLNPSLGSDAGQPDLLAAAKSLEADGGGDYPEATKTALAKAYQEMRPDAKTIVLVYTDAPPHTQRDVSVSQLLLQTLDELMLIFSSNSFNSSDQLTVREKREHCLNLIHTVDMDHCLWIGSLLASNYATERSRPRYSAFFRTTCHGNAFRTTITSVP